jgi:small membrane protein
MILIQYLAVIFSVFAISRVFLRWKDKCVKATEFMFWCVIWGTVIAVSVFPGIFTWLSLTLGIGRGVDILLYGGMIVIFYLMFRLYVKSENQQQEITKLVREIALRTPKKQRKEKKEQ